LTNTTLLPLRTCTAIKLDAVVIQMQLFLQLEKMDY